MGDNEGEDDRANNNYKQERGCKFFVSPLLLCRRVGRISRYGFPPVEGCTRGCRARKEGHSSEREVSGKLARHWEAPGCEREDGADSSDNTIRSDSRPEFPRQNTARRVVIMILSNLHPTTSDEITT